MIPLHPLHPLAPPPRPHPTRRTTGRLPRTVAVLTAGLLLMATAGVQPASAHYVQPPGEEEAAPGVVQVQVDYTYTVGLPTKRGRSGLVPALVPGPRGTGAVVNSGGSVLTSETVAYPAHGREQQITAINQAIRERYHTSWTDRQLSTRQPLPDTQLRSCYTDPDSCAKFSRYARSVVLATAPAQKLLGKSARSISDGLAVIATKADRDLTPTVGVTETAPQPGGSYKAVGWSADKRLPAIAVTFEGTAFRPTDLENLGGSLNGGDGVVIVDGKSRGNVVAVVRRAADGTLSTALPFRPLQLDGVTLDRGPLHPSIDQALGYFMGNHYTHAVPLLEEVTRQLPDQLLLDKLAIAKAKQNGPEDKSNAPSESMPDPASGGLSWPVIIGLGALAVVVALVVLAVLLRRRRQRPAPPTDADPADPADPADGTDAGIELEDMLDEEYLADSFPAADAGTQPPDGDGFRGEGGGRAQPVAATTVKSLGGGHHAGSFCSECGVGLTAGDRFCYHCGTPAR